MTPYCLLLGCFGLGNATVAERAGLEPAPSEHDGVYGRFDNDLDGGIGLGVAVARPSPSLALRGTLHYFSTAGLYLSGELPTTDAPRSSSMLSFGVDLRPSFLPRFSEGLEQGPAWLDLGVDSISLSLGPYFAVAGDPSGGRGLEASLGAGLPLFGQMAGPWLEVRGLSRIPDSDEDAWFGALVLLAWHGGFASPWLQPAR